MTRSTFTPAEAAELAVVIRGGFVESRHIGSAVVLDPSGSPVLSLGAPEVPVFTRSSLKPLQAIAAMSLGARLEGVSAALASASHKSEAGHVEVVEQMLADVGLTDSDLRCPPAHPADGSFRRSLQAKGFSGESRLIDPKSRLYFNCSGKHAAFLAAAVAQGATTADYLDPAHPVQAKVAEVVETFADETPAAVGIDGCGAPVFALSLIGLARAIGRVVRLGSSDGSVADGVDGHGVDGPVADGVDPGTASAPESSSAYTAYADYTAYAAEARTLIDAVFAHPWAIEGHGRPNSTVIDRLGVFAKGGAEGVIVMATRTGYSVALKCLDGSSRATGLVALRLLERAGAFARSSEGDEDGAASASDPVITEELLAQVIAAITEPVTGGADSEGRTAVVGRIDLGEDVSQGSRGRRTDGDSQKN
ncbi:MAG: asparaginase [Brevibacterium sp.]